MPIITLTEVKAFLDITDDAKDTKITLLIPEVEGFAKKYCNDEFTTVPAGLKRAISELIRFDLNERVKASITSESLGDYSVSYNNSGSYPINVLKLLDPYKRLGWL